MPLGTTAQSVSNMPATAYVVSDDQWNSTAKKNVKQILSTPYSDTNAVQLQLPQSGLAAELLMKFDGTLVVGTAVRRRRHGAVALRAPRVLRAQRQRSTGPFRCDRRGPPLPRGHRIPRRSPSRSTSSPDRSAAERPSAIGSYPVSLSWRVPIATELVTLTGALYAQSPSTQIQVTISPAGIAHLVPAGAGGTSVLTGTWTVTETFFVPAYDSQGRIIVPSGIAYLHTMQAVDLPLTGTGDNRLLLVRGSGNMQRLFMAFTDSAGTRMSTAPGTAADELIDSLVLTYGADSVPIQLDPGV